MSKNFSTIQKKNGARPDTRFRELVPQAHQTKAGAQLLCPFCIPSHPLVPGVPNPCGTVLNVTAAQMIYTKRAVAAKKLICSKCKQGGGEMVQYMNVYAHIPDCKPDTFLLPQLPTFSRTAAVVYKMSDGPIKKWFEKRYGRAQQVQDIDIDGNKTGKVLGYFFLKIPQQVQGVMGNYLKNRFYLRGTSWLGLLNTFTAFLCNRVLVLHRNKITKKTIKWTVARGTDFPPGKIPKEDA